MKNQFLKHAFFTLLSLLPPAYLGIIWSAVPQIVPTHFGVHGPNEYGDKSTLLMGVLTVAGAAIFCYFLMQYIGRVDPKRSGKPTAPVFNKIAIGITIFLLVMNFMIILACAKGYELTKAIFCLAGLLFAFLGNVMHNLKPNYFVGIRIPWTLSSDYNWRKTHQMAGKLWFVAGLLFTLFALFAPLKITDKMLEIFVLVIAGIPIAYSYILYRKEQANPDITNTNN